MIRFWQFLCIFATISCCISSLSGKDCNNQDNNNQDDNNQDDNQEDDNNQDDNQEEDGNGDGSDVVIKETIEDVYEPFLMQLGFISRTPRGRIALEPAYKHIGVEFDKQ